MNIIFEEGGQFKTARVLTENEATLQIELSTGKRSKLKRNNVIFSYSDGPALTALIPEAEVLADEIEAEFLWECAPQDQDLSAEQMAQEYFGETPTIVQKTALLLRLHASPIYFHRRGKGLYRAAPPDILEAALAAVAKKRQQEEQQAAWVEQLCRFELPEEMAQVAPSFLVQPDKNTLAWKAFEQALAKSQLSVAAMLLKLGVYPDELSLTLARFLQQHFPKGLEPVDLPVPASPELPLAQVEAYSIDDAATSEIDDAFSVQALGDERYRIGVHIAAPALVVAKDTELDLAARRRMSTIYLPGKKITMQHDRVVAQFSLEAGEPRPCVSLYTEVDFASNEIGAGQSVLETIVVKENLRHHQLDAITHDRLEDPNDVLPYNEITRPLWRFSRLLSAARDEVRGYPERHQGIEFNVTLEGDWQDQSSTVVLVPRRRDAPLDLLVGELMIHTNVHWSGLLDRLKLAGIFRSQQFGRPKHSTHAIEHQSMGVPQYAWMTSPLRRYVDLLNQQQLICAIQHGVSAPLVAPYQKKDIDLLQVMNDFDSTYQQWRHFQDTMTRFWTLRWIQQQGLDTVEATVLRDDMVRFCNAPLVTSAHGMPADLERGTVVRLSLGDIDLLEQRIEARFVEVIATPEAADDVTTAQAVRCAVYGYPIEHSMSPVLHQLAAQQVNLDLQYDKVAVAPEDFETQVEQFFKDGGRGLNITIPFKLRAFEMAQANLSERARAAQSVNTLWQVDGQIHGDNTDGIGLVNDIEQHGYRIQGKRVLLIGAGGAARGAMLPLIEAGCAALHIANRTESKAAALVQQVGQQEPTIAITSSGLETIPSSWDIVINASASSLAGDQLPLPDTLFAPGALAYDMYYHASGDTAFLQQARALGASHTLDGLGMLVEQGLASFTIWHSITVSSPPILQALRAHMQACNDTTAASSNED